MDAATRDRFESVLARLLEGEPEPGDGAWLADLFRRDAEAARQATGLLAIDDLLRQQAEPEPEAFAEGVRTQLETEVEREVFGRRVARAVKPTRNPPGVLARSWHWVLAAAAVVAVGFFLFSHVPADPRGTNASQVAFLRRSAGAVWGSGGAAPVTDGPIGCGSIRLAAGLAEIEFASGARMILEGPAHLRITSQTAVFCHEGRLRVLVPPQAHGFQVGLAQLTIIDLGTSFGVAALSNSPPMVKVFQGEIEAARAEQRRRIVQGAGVTVDAEGVLQAAAVDDDLFPSEAELLAGSVAENRLRLRAWRETVARLAADPATLLCYSFEDESDASHSVRNRANGATESSHGLLVGTGWTEGRWPGKHGIEFRSLGDRVRFTLPGSHATLTLLAWMRVDSLQNQYTALLFPAHDVTGSLHWMLERDGSLRLTMLNDERLLHRGGGWDGPVRGAAVSGTDLGRWVFLATTYNAATGEAILYRDGRPIGSGRLAHGRKAVLGPMEFGNMDTQAVQPGPGQPQPPDAFRVRNFVGRLDELAIIGRVMPAAEIAQHYEAGKP